MIFIVALLWLGYALTYTGLSQLTHGAATGGNQQNLMTSLGIPNQPLATAAAKAAAGGNAAAAPPGPASPTQGATPTPVTGGGGSGGGGSW